MPYRCLASVLLVPLFAANASASERIALTVGQLTIPPGFSTSDGAVQLLVHFHGDPKVVEQNVARLDASVVIVNVTLNGLSGVYRDKFLKPETAGKHWSSHTANSGRRHTPPQLRPPIICSSNCNLTRSGRL